MCANCRQSRWRAEGIAGGRTEKWFSTRCVLIKVNCIWRKRITVVTHANTHANDASVAYERLLAEIPALRAEALQLREQAAKIGDRAQRLEQAVAALEALSGTPSPTSRRNDLHQSVTRPSDTDGGVPTGIAAVRRVMAESDQVWRPSDVQRILEERGWLTGRAKRPISGTQNRIIRLVRAGAAERVGRGQYRYRGSRN